MLLQLWTCEQQRRQQQQWQQQQWQQQQQQEEEVEEVRADVRGGRLSVTKGKERSG